MYTTSKIIGFVLLAALTMSAFGQRSYDREHEAKINQRQKKVDSSFGGFRTESGEEVPPEKVSLSAMRERANLMLMNRRRALMAQKVGNDGATASDGEHSARSRIEGDGHVSGAAEGHSASAQRRGDRVRVAGDRQQAQGNLMKQGRRIVGGTGAAGKHNVLMRNGPREFEGQADRQYELHGRALSRNEYTAGAQNTRNGDSGSYGVNSESLNRKAASGTLTANQKTDEQFGYKLKSDGARSGRVDLQALNQNSRVFNRRNNRWTCEAQKDGESLCRDALGAVVGRVIANSRGEVLVSDENGVVRGRGKAQKINDQQYSVELNQGIASARTKRIEKSDCMPSGESRKDKIRVSNVQAFVNGENVADGSVSYAWPSCFNITADVTVPPGIDSSRLAFEYVGHVMPLGNFKCSDAGTCGRSCYYCNACEKQKILDEPLFTDGNFCALSGGTSKLRMEVCPPSELEKAAFCGGFARHLFGNNYYKYDGSINTEVRVWLRPENEQTLRSNYFNLIKLPGQKLLLQGAYQTEAGLRGQVDPPSDNELLEWYVRKNGQETMQACQRAIIDYQLGGSKVDSNLVLDAFANLPSQAGGAGRSVKLFSDRPCDEWKEQQAAEYAHYLAEHNAKHGSRPTNNLFGSFTRFGNLFGANRRQ